MNADTASRRLPAEWEPSKAILMAWPHEETDWAPMLDEVTACYKDIVSAIAEEMWVVIVAPDISLPKKHLEPLGLERVVYCQVLTNDTWARDFGPITVYENGHPAICDFQFNGWGLKFAACHDNLITRKLFDAGLLRGKYDNFLGFTLEGGSIDSDGRGTILTTSECLMSPNRNGDLSRQQIERHLMKTLGANRILWLDHGYLAGDDTDSHIDTLARFAPGDIILYVKCDDPADEHYAELHAMERQLASLTTADGNPYNLIGLPMPDAIFDEDGERLPATYANFLVTPQSVLMPSYGQPDNDLLASQILRIAFPDRTIKPIDCRALIRQHGSLHCVTMQLLDETLPI